MSLGMHKGQQTNLQPLLIDREHMTQSHFKSFYIAHLKENKCRVIKEFLGKFLALGRLQLSLNMISKL